MGCVEWGQNERDRKSNCKYVENKIGKIKAQIKDIKVNDKTLKDSVNKI